MGSSNNTNRYYRLWKGTNIVETNADAEQREVYFGKIQTDVFEGRSFERQIIQRIGDTCLLLRVTYQNKKYYLLVLNVKNSGQNTKEEEMYKKRLQVSSKIDDIPVDEPLYVLGAYNAGDKIIYVSSEITESYWKAKRGSSYSSLWIEFEYLDRCYKEGSCNWFDSKSRFYSAATDKCVKEMTDIELSTRLFGSTGIYPQTEIVIGDDNAVLPLQAPTTARVSTIRLMPRNKNYKREALRRERYTCELCGTKKTFGTDHDVEQYFEGHHLLMYHQTVQNRYTVSIDNPENIMCLCPMCHSKIHHSTAQEKRELVIRLLNKHYTKLSEIYGLSTKEDLEMIIDDYVNNLPDTGGDDDE